TLAALAAEQHVEVQLMLGIYEMSDRNTPGVGRVLSKYGLSYIPEAHCYLRYQGERIDVTGVPPGAEPITRILHEEPITIDRIGASKNDLHKKFLAEWIPGIPALRGDSLARAWGIREECLAALSAGEPATPER